MKAFKFLLALSLCAACEQAGDALTQEFNGELKAAREGNAAELSPELISEVKSVHFILYPGHGGAKPDVYSDNIRCLKEDFSVRADDIEIRDVEDANREKPNDEFAFLQTAWERGGRKPLVLIAHSAHGVEVFNTVLLHGKELLDGGILKRVVLIESPISDSSGVAKLSAEEKAASLGKVFYVPYPGDSTPEGFGTKLGSIRASRYVGPIDHIDTVVSAPRSKQEYIFRQTFTRFLMKKIFPNTLAR